MKYNKLIVTAWFQDNGLPAPDFEYVFASDIGRRWRFDICWPDHRVAIEVNGGIWIRGGHNRGAQMLKDWEKWNTATAIYRYHMLFCQPKDLCTKSFLLFVQHALMIQGSHESPKYP